MKSKPLISICIPTYNGGSFFLDTIQSIAPHLSERVELVISDDCSQDETCIYADALQVTNPHVRFYKNKENLGMDENFTQVARLAAGEYVWFCGQDDLLGKEVIDRITTILLKNKLSILNVNFSQYDHNLTTCLIPSFFERASFKEYSNYEAQDLILFKNPNEYFKIFTQPPSFLPAVIMRREYWDGDLPRKFYGTYFVQLGVLLSNMHKGNIGAFTKPLIKGRVPDNQWQRDGNKLFFIMCGDIQAKKIAFDNNFNLPKLIYLRDILRFTLNYPFFLTECKARGFNQIEKSLVVLKNVYGKGGLYRLVILPITLTPLWVLRFVTRPLGFIKRILFRFRIFEKLRG